MKQDRGRNNASFLLGRFTACFLLVLGNTLDYKHMSNPPKAKNAFIGPNVEAEVQDLAPTEEARWHWEWEGKHLEEARSLSKELTLHLNTLTMFVLGFNFTALQLRSGIDSSDAWILFVICGCGLVSLWAGMANIGAAINLLNKVAHQYALLAQGKASDEDIPSRSVPREGTVQWIFFLLSVLFSAILAGRIML